MAQRFVSMDGSVTLGGCVECVTRLVPEMRSRLADVVAELPEWIMGTPPQWKRVANKRCARCKWTGHEMEMGHERTMFGDGWFPAVCPSCLAENGLGSHPVETVDGYTVIASSTPTPMGHHMKAARRAALIAAEPV